MQDVTYRMLKFKEAIRHNWNAYLSDSEFPMSPDIQEAFETIERGLFSAIVLSDYGLCHRAAEYRKHPLTFISVKLVSELSQLPLQIGKKDSNGNTIWSPAISFQVDQSFTLEFFDFFDWYPYSFIDLPYIRARVSSKCADPRLQNATVLIEQRHCRFYVTE